MKIGIIGLGKMGSRIAQKLADAEHEVFVWNRSSEDVAELKKVAKVEGHESIESLVKSLPAPRIVWIMVPHAAVEEVLTEVRKFISAGDIVIDGGNSNYKDTDRRFAEFEKNGIKFLGIGVSGGIIAFKNGYPLMAGGNREAYDLIKPIFDTLSNPDGGYGFFGIGGAGHFVKMVHNGIEYAQMQAIGEGFEILEKSKYDLNLSKVAKVWQRGSIISGFLIDRSAEVLKDDVRLSDFGGPISRSGEGDWTLLAAKEEGLDPEVIDESVEFRKKSETNENIQNSFTAKMINALRYAFGGHQIKK
ncbi:MAG: decarboxylating 6-phosphogluconate dehydrogenase [Candidatus Levybacteria bacterium]|nr:decarboxylating 6-phosphogluconate dehydrogenase [Candidatus Levybacteria bacterium]